MTADRVPARRSVRAAVRSVLALTLALVVGLLPLGLAAGSLPSAHAAPAGSATVATLGLTEVTPSTITSSTGHHVTVRGRLVNTSNRPLTDLSVRLRRSAAITESYRLRSALTAPEGEFGIVSAPQRIGSDLAAGASIEFSIEVGINGPGGLGLAAAGVYPLMVDVTGSRRGGGVSSVADSRTLLPVLSLPSHRQRAADYIDPAAGRVANPLLGRDGSVAANATDPAAFTLIWPLAATPQEAAGILGGGTADLRLVSDALGRSLGSDGRLGTMLNGLGEFTGDTESADAPAGLRDAVCVAVDPDLLSTVARMADGYVVANDPGDPRSGTHPGTGRRAAASWLEKLRRVAARQCVTALPFAQAGPDSLRTIGDDALTARALTSPSDIVDSILGVKTQRGLTIPATGTLTDDTRDLLAAHDLTAAAVASSTLTPLDATDRSPVSGASSGRYRSADTTLQSYDVGISAALGAAGTTPVVPAIMPNWQQPDLTDESSVSRRQTAIASLAFPMLSAAAPRTDDATTDTRPLPTTGRSAFIMPPTYWSPTLDDARALRNTAALLMSTGTARPTSLETVIAELPATTGAARLEVPGDVTPAAAAGYPVSRTEAETIRQRLRMLDKLEAALVGNADTVTTPAEYLGTLRDDLLRAVSVASTTETAIAHRSREQRLTAVGSTLREMRDSVAMLDPSGRYTLASERSPLLLVVRNTLALPIRVRLGITAPDNLEIGDLGVFEIPAEGTRQLQIPTHATSSEPASVHIGLVTVSDVPLSMPIELSVYANAYGKALFWITVIAAIVLILLTARRLWHRFRGKPDRADEDRPEPDDDHREQAALSYQARLAAQSRVGTEEPVDVSTIESRGAPENEETDTDSGERS